MTNKGRIDITIKFKEKIYIIEFKVNSQVPSSESQVSDNNLLNEALEQLKKKEYYKKYLNPKSKNEDTKIYLIGIVFSEEEKNIIKFDWEEIKNK